MGLPIEEQETVINFSRDEERATVYTSDSTMITKLNKLISTEGTEWQLDEIIKDKRGEEVARTYSCPKKLVSYRARSMTRELTEEERKAKSDRMKAMHDLNRVSN